MSLQQKIEANGTEIQGDCFQSIVWRPENAVSRAQITATDSDGTYFLDNLDAFDILKISYKQPYETAWTQVFEGRIREPSLILQQQQKTATALAYGYGKALLDTHCSVNYGVESENTTIDTPSEIIEDLRANRINKNFDGNNTGYAILGGKILSMTAPSIQFIKGGYRKNTDILNQLCQIYQGYQAGSAGIHWFIDPTKTLYVDQIGNHTVAGWSTWYDTDQAHSTFTEDKDFKQYSLPKNAKEYANKILLFTDVRKPGYDIWNEDGVGYLIWGNYGFSSVADSAAQKVVGSHSLALTINGAAPGESWMTASPLTGDAAAAQKDVAVTSSIGFKVGDSVHLWDNTPLSEDATIASIAGNTLTMEANLTNAYAVANSAHCTLNAGWDITKIGSEKSPPTLNFYCYPTTNIYTAVTWVKLFTTAFDTDYFYCNFLTNMNLDSWTHFSLPIGPYWNYKSPENDSSKIWQASSANADWSNINGIGFYTFNGTGTVPLYIDDLCISGKIVREAYDSDEITAKGIEIQKTVRMDVTADDTLKQSDDSGTAARIAYAELLRSMTTPITGSITLERGIPSILPGQQVYLNARKRPDGTYAISDTFRVTQITHRFTSEGMATILDVTDDLINTFCVGPAEQLTSLAKVMYVDPEAKSLKSSGIDELVPRLSVDYA